MRRLRLLHPFLFLLVSLLIVYTATRLIASPLQILRPLFILWGLLLILYPLCTRLAGNEDWAAILLSILVFGFCYTRRAFVQIGLLSLVLVAVTMLTLRLLKRKIGVRHASTALTAVAAAIALAQIASLALIFKTIPASYFRDMAARADNRIAPLSSSVQEKPDIYYIVLDGYPRSDVLMEIFEYDNSTWVEELKGMGFVVPENSHANYSRTAISVSTTLDMQYWDSIAPGMEETIYWWLVEPVMDHSRLRASLETIGYEYVAIATDWGITDNPTADRYLKPYPGLWGDYEKFYLTVTPLTFLRVPLQTIAPIVDDEIHRNYIRYTLETLKSAPSLPGPKFVFAHIISPHPPFVFDAEGRPLDSEAGFTFYSPDIGLFSKTEYKARYADQARFIDDRMNEVVRALLEDSSVPPIIIIQADHGSALYVDFDDPEGSCIKERFSNFAAYYLPGKPASVIPPDISAVNIFRIVLDEYFGAQLGLLENHQYFMNGFYLFDQLDVTGRVNDACVFAE